MRSGPNKDHRPRAGDARLETTALSRSSVHPLTGRPKSSSHPESLSMRDTKHFLTFGTEIDVTLPKHAAQGAAPHGVQFLIAVRANRRYVSLFYALDHGMAFLRLRSVQRRAQRRLLAVRWSDRLGVKYG